MKRQLGGEVALIAGAAAESGPSRVSVRLAAAAEPSAN